MATVDRSSPIPYAPAAPADATDQTRAVWDEFYKIAQGLFEVDRPVAVTGSSNENVTIGPTIQWDRLFDEATAIQYQRPAGQVDPLTGIWTAPIEGLYLIQPVIEVPAFPATGTYRQYTATLRTTETPPGGAPIVKTSSTGGEDSVALRLLATFLLPMEKGTTMYWDLDLTHESRTGQVSVLSVINITRQSSIK